MARAATKVARRSTDWDSAKATYVQGTPTPSGATHYPTLDEIARQYGRDPRHVRKVAATGGWTEARREFAERLQQVKGAARIQELASRGAKFDSRMFDLANALAGMVALRLNELSQVDANGSRKSVRTAELVALTLAAKHAQATGKVALGDWSEDGPAPGGAIAIHIIREGPTPQYGGKG